MANTMNGMWMNEPEMVDLKLPKRDTKETPEPVEAEQERWPYGLKLDFESEEVNKFPELKGAKIGQKIMVAGMGEVVSVRMREETRGGQKYNVEVQLKKIDLVMPGKDKEEEKKEE